MQSRTSWFKKELWKQDFRNVGWVSIVYFVGLFFCLPIMMLMRLEDIDMYIEYPIQEGLFSVEFAGPIQAIFMFAMPILMAVFLFRYLHVKKAADFNHSLPVTRQQLFHHHMISGIVFLLAPVFLIGIIQVLLHTMFDVHYFYGLRDVAFWLLATSMNVVSIFIFSVFIGTLTGISAVQAVLTGIFLVFLDGMYVLIGHNLDVLLNGYAAIQFQLDHSLSPVINGIQMIEEQWISGWMMIQYVVGMIVFYLLALFIYRYRHLETASQAIAIPKLKPLFKYGVTFCFMLLGGVIFGSGVYSITWLLFGYVVGASIGYVIATILLVKTWRIFSLQHAKGLAAYGIVVSLLFGLVQVDAFSYESYVPKQEDVKAVYVGGYSYIYTDMDKELVTEDPATIATTIDLHEQAIDVSSPVHEYEHPVFIAYHLENGDQVYREYRVNKEDIQTEWEKLYNTDGFKEVYYNELSIDVSDIEKLEFEGNSIVSFNNADEMEQLLNNLRKDVYNESYNESQYEQGVTTHMSSVLKDRGYYNNSIVIKQSYEHTINWLKEKGYYKQVFLHADDVEVMKVASEYDDPYVLEEEGKKVLTTKDKGHIQEALEKVNSVSSGEYSVFLFTSSNMYEYETYSFSEENAPDWVKEHFE
ncbi:DUF6449 domain-containing protein [Pontibacillus litoralis]|uniref:DUF6449 domain-containing protein n=1 Tax=Pontibacillus litoralis JSM 072002 TaxID=1385512 RepID=A0A0A5G5A6_9BACI|nr:DUF6449 domain-containing protein [Pontibacillus litoralis]KGX86338.1 hypothetical protein N784_05150 [Pontibacillus litoralis JSM 072002]